MELYKHEKGQAIDKIDITRTCDTLEIGETWRTSETELGTPVFNVRAYTSRLGSLTGKFFSVVTRSLDEGDIVITRIK